MKCEEARIQLADLVTGEASQTSTKKLEQHLMDCAGCRREFAGLGELSAGLRMMEPTKPPGSLRIGFEFMLQEAIRNPRSLENGAISADKTGRSANLRREDEPSIHGWLGKLVMQHRWNLAGLAFCCLTTACLQLATPADPISIASAQGKSGRKSSEQLAEVREFRRFYAELLEMRERKSGISVVLPVPPAPRSENVRAVRG